MQLKKHVVFLFIAMTVGVLQSPAAIIYVDASATGANSGANWTDAYWDLQTALNPANHSPGDEIWIAQGTYYPGGIRSASFILPGDDLAGIYGGFDASAMPTNKCQANPVLFPTILSGNFNGSATKTDNTERMIVIGLLNAPLVLDGLTIVDCYADGIAPANSGAAIHYAGNSGHMLSVRRCTVTGHHADANGGGIYIGPNAHFELQTACGAGNYLADNDATLGGALFIDMATMADLFTTTFEGNNATDGGACYYEQPGIVNHDEITFEQNRAINGGAIYDNASPALHINLSVFQSNIATSFGGGIYSNAGHWDIHEAEFHENRARSGGAIYATSAHMHIGGAPSLFAINRASSDGGAIYFDGMMSANLTMTDFNENVAGSDGGAIYMNQGMADITECNFGENFALSRGGGICAYGSDQHIANVTFTDHQATDGAAIYAFEGFLHLNGPATFETGTAVDNGGAIYMEDVSAMNVDGGTFTSNSATSGGALFLTNSAGPIEFSAFSDNSASNLGGAIAIFSSDPVDINSSSFDLNRTPNSAGKTGGTIHASNSTITATGTDFVTGISHDGAGIWMDQSNWHSNTCFFESNSGKGFGGALYADDSDVLSEEDEFNFNSSGGGGAIYLKEGCTMTLRHGFAQSNTSGQHGGFMLNAASSDVFIGNFQAIGNHAANGNGGLFYSGAADADYFVANTVATCNYADQGNLYYGAGVNAILRVYFSTFFANTHPGLGGYSLASGNTAFEGTSTSNALVANSILWQNQEITFCDPITVEYCDVDTSWDCSSTQWNTYPGTGNINARPAFVNPSSPCVVGVDLRLPSFGPVSPCLDTADTSIYLPQDFADVDYDGDDTDPLSIDFLGGARIYNTKADMGAYENDGTYKQQETAMVKENREIRVFPNPTMDRVQIVSDDPVQQVQLFNLSGQLMEAYTTVLGNRAEVDLSDLGAGLYILRISDASGRSAIPVTKQ